jgi:tRNA 2-thiouridine synthesizing protein A
MPFIFSSNPTGSKQVYEKSMNFDQELDVRGLVCPLPLLRTKKSLASMSSGQILRIVATDPGTEIDFLVYVEESGNELLSFLEVNYEFTYYIKKS